MATLFEMPKLGMDMEEGTIVKWRKAEGDTVKKGEILAEIETDKTTVEVESPCDGVVLKLYHGEGETLPVTKPIAAIGAAGEAAPVLDKFAPVSTAPVEKSVPAATVDFAGTLFEMPKLGMDMEEGTIVKWRKAEGDTVKKGEILAEIETDKTTVEVESPCGGVVLKLYYAEGETLPVTKPIAAIGAAGMAVPSLDQLSGAAANAAPAPMKEAAPAAEKPVAEPSRGKRGKIRISPRAKRLAEKNHIDLSLLTATGPSGRIVEKDVRAYMANPAPAASAAVKPVEEKEYDLIPLTSMRRTIARRMFESTSTIPTFTLEIRADMRRAIALRQAMKEKKIKVSFHDIIAKCACSAAKLHPLVNASYGEDGIRQYHSTNVGIAVSVDGGLVVPVVRNIDSLRVSEIAAASAAVIEKARTGKLEPNDMKGGHFTISNLGMYPLNSFTAIINPPESCILACAGMLNVPKVENGQLVEIPTMSITATFDHRLIDGAYGAEFMTTLKEYIEDPAMVIM